ncbi:cytochrome P450 [Neohortaea acidophila]|uniref:Cytochrome P450 n=1 Tax=Neohortaea acidophila TaxID=245834 RepID=A0A6A6PZE1_9PEZI|nr:cytochrome P450 [Neohortaea acidophila]KAF2485382.1 cytochrome P450 [Neohortaea acidophila]
MASFYEVAKQHPKRAAAQTLMHPVAEKYDLGDYFYLDVWPFGWPMLIILNTDMMNEIEVKTSLPKHPATDQVIRHTGGPGNLVSAEGQTWKRWRSAFNPGFSASHLMTLVPAIVDQCSIFCNTLTRHAERQDLFRMDPETTKLTIDIIGKVALDLDFRSQKEPNELVDTFVNQLRWMNIGVQPSIQSFLDFRAPIMRRYNTWKMDRYITKRLTERVATRTSRGKGKAVIDLALESYLKDVQNSGQSVDDVKTLPKDFTEAAISNLKVFIFAGHDTTSATICYTYYYLSRNPTVLAKVRRELDEVFGTDPTAVGEHLKRDAYLLNKLEYLLLVIREVLRLQTPASSIRTGYKGFVLRDPRTGEAIPADDNFLIYPTGVGFGRSKQYWGDADVFRPERFLETYNKDAWLPFSRGIRNCIGQELAMIEMRIILAMTLRSFDFHEAFDELEKLKGDGSGYPSDTTGVQEQFGEPAYQVQVLTAKPREGMPCRVSLRKQ